MGVENSGSGCFCVTRGSLLRPRLRLRGDVRRSIKRSCGWVGDVNPRGVVRKAPAGSICREAGGGGLLGRLQ